jgi:hypothetical protein
MTETARGTSRGPGPYNSSQDGNDDNAGYRHYYGNAREAGPGAGEILLTYAEGSEVDAVAVAVLLLTRHHSRFDSYSRGHYERRYRHVAGVRGLRVGARDIRSYSAYQASQVIDQDPRVSHVWEGLLGWQDAGRVQAELVAYAS